MSFNLKKIASNLESQIDSQSATVIYRQIGEIMRENLAYFKNMSSLDAIKIVIYIFSYKNYGSFEWADTNMSKFYNSSFFLTEGDSKYYAECGECGGGGTIECGECNGVGNTTCDVCDGDGTVSCDTCDGSGAEDCDVCGGSGEIDGETCDECNGKGQIECTECYGDGSSSCSECGGDGRSECRDCNGNGEYNCDYCDGDGEYETDEDKYTTWNYIILDTKILNRVFDSYELKKPTYLEIDDEKNILLSSFEGHGFLLVFVEPNQEYCYFLEKLQDNPPVEIVTKTTVFHTNASDLGKEFVR
jgi:hypothetical protein